MSAKIHTIDATGKRLGRLATEVATLLMGKDSTKFVKHKAPSVEVIIQNASKLDISPKKMEQKIYTSYSGYPGGLKKRPMNKVIEKHGYEEVVRKAVHGMLPGNKLRPIMMKNLKVIS